MNFLRRLFRWYFSPVYEPRRPVNSVNEALMRRVEEAERRLPADNVVALRSAAFLERQRAAREFQSNGDVA